MTTLKNFQIAKAIVTQLVVYYNHFHTIFRIFNVLPNAANMLQANATNIHTNATNNITYKHVIYELPHKLPNDLRLMIFGN